MILNWNNAPDTLECLASLKKVTEPAYEIFVIDNGSTDDSLTKIQKAYPKHHYIHNSQNLGYAEGNNRGLRIAMDWGAQFFVILNNDVIVAPDFLSEIVKAAEQHPEAGAFGPKMYYYDQPATIWYAGGSVDKKTGRCFHFGCDASEGYNEIRETDYICGCALAVRREVIEKVGFISPEYFLIWEEIDWCYRMRSAGYKCLYIPTSKIWHKISSSFSEGNRGPMWQYYYFRNRLLFHKKHRVTFPPIPLRECIDLLQRLCNRDPLERKRSRAAFKGITHHFLRRYERQYAIKNPVKKIK